MQKVNPVIPSLSSEKLKIWVLAPYLQSNDENIDYYYDFSQSIAEYSKTFEEMGVEWVWQPVTMQNYEPIIAGILAEKEAGSCIPIVFNICDGDEVNGTPGISVVKLLSQSGLVFTGADEYFYDITTSKIPMKLAFDKAGIPTAAWEAIMSPEQQLEGIFERLGSPLIIKPSVSGGSMGLGIKNVVTTECDLKLMVNNMFAGYRGWNLVTDGLIAESFVNGNEYTTLIVGAYDKPEFAVIYNPVQRVFHSSLPDTEKILSFDRLWEIYEEEPAMPNEGNFYEYEAPEPGLIDEIKKISWDAYVATKGKGYTRVDLRQDKITGKLFVLEVNAQCGLSEDEDYTSIGAILRLSGKTYTELVKEIINTAFLTSATKAQKRKRTKLVKIDYQLPLSKIGDSA
jgi:D-alanine-D-alanine ligase